MRANLLFSRSEVERSELKNSTVYKLSVIGLGNTATVCVCVCVCTVEVANLLPNWVSI